MADNITISEGTAKGIKTDEVGTAHYQEIKLDMGEGGSSLPFTGTIPEITNIADGTVVVGTVPGIGVLADGTVAVTFDADLPGGTVDIIAAGTLTSVQGGTVGKVDSLGTIDGTVESVGTVQKVGTVDRITRGTLDSVGTITGMGVLASGSIVVTDGTIGDMDTIGTVGVLEDGTVAVTFDADLPGGTVDLVTRTGKVGTVENLDGGTLAEIASLGTIDGTIENIGTVHNIGTIGVINDGTIVTTIGDITGGTIDAITAGTITVGGGTVTTQLAGTQELLGTVNTVGTVNVLKDGTVGEIGTVTGLGVLALGTVKVTEGSADITALGGTIENLDSGTITSVANLASGTVTRIEGGTIGILTNGTVQVGNLGGGTVQINPKGGGSAIITYGTLADSAGAEFGTISAASGAGTYHYVQGCSITVLSGTVDCYLGYGSLITGTNVIARGSFPEGGGIARSFTPSPLSGSGTNTELIYKNAGAGTVMYNVDFWRGV